jgi:hypothetical protein
MHQARCGVVLAIALLAALPPAAQAQLRKLRVVSTDSQPVAYAYVTLDGGSGQITDEKGEVSLGAGALKTFTVNVRRIGYQQWFGKLELPDTAAVLTVTLARIAQTLGAVRVSGNSGAPSSLPLRGFYDRWLMRQKGLLSAVFIGPEEIEFRNPDKITNMLSGLNGVTLKRSCEGAPVAFGYNGRCQMAILVDGVRQCPGVGCNVDPTSMGLPGPPHDHSCTSLKLIDAQTAVLIDQVLNANDVAAIEVYNRGGNMPVSLQASDQACGVIAFWTGSRKP